MSDQLIKPFDKIIIKHSETNLVLTAIPETNDNMGANN